MTNLDRFTSTEDVKLTKEINEATPEWWRAEQTSKSRSERLGGLLLEVKKLYPKPDDFIAFLRQTKFGVYSKSHAYLLMQMVDPKEAERQRKALADRQQRHRDKKKQSQAVPALPSPPPAPSISPMSAPPISPMSAPAGNDVDAQASADARKQQNAEAEHGEPKKARGGDSAQIKKGSPEWYLREFGVACNQYLSKLTTLDHLRKADEIYNSVRGKAAGRVGEPVREAA